MSGVRLLPHARTTSFPGESSAPEQTRDHLCADAPRRFGPAGSAVRERATHARDVGVTTGDPTSIRATAVFRAPLHYGHGLQGAGCERQRRRRHLGSSQAATEATAHGTYKKNPAASRCHRKQVGTGAKAPVHGVRFGTAEAG